MFPFPHPVRMPGAIPQRQRQDRRKRLPAIFAGIDRLFVTLVQCVFPFPSPVRVPGAVEEGKSPHIRTPLSTVLAVIVRHFHSLSCFYDRRRLHSGEARRFIRSKRRAKSFLSRIPCIKPRHVISFFEHPAQNYGNAPRNCRVRQAEIRSWHDFCFDHGVERKNDGEFDGKTTIRAVPKRGAATAASIGVYEARGPRENAL